MFRLAKQRPFLVAAFLLATALTLFFSGRLLVRAIYWADPAHHNETVKPWMTVGYIARSWRVDPQELDAIANLPMPKEKGHPQPLAEIAQDRGVPVSDVIAEVTAALAILKAKPTE